MEFSRHADCYSPLHRKILSSNVCYLASSDRLSGGFSEIFLNYFLASEIAGPAIAGDPVVEIDLFANIRKIGRYRPGAMIAGRSKSLKRN
jgi:hypothetical protein